MTATHSHSANCVRIRAYDGRECVLLAAGALTQTIRFRDSGQTATLPTGAYGKAYRCDDGEVRTAS